MANERLIDANNFRIPKGFFDNGINVPKILDLVAKQPIVDAVEVVRCKDCKMEYGCRVAQWLGENGFCSYGERKE